MDNDAHDGLDYRDRLYVSRKEGGRRLADARILKLEEYTMKVKEGLIIATNNININGNNIEGDPVV